MVCDLAQHIYIYRTPYARLGGRGIIVRNCKGIFKFTNNSKPLEGMLESQFILELPIHWIFTF